VGTIFSIGCPADTVIDHESCPAMRVRRTGYSMPSRSPARICASSGSELDAVIEPAVAHPIRFLDYAHGHVTKPNFYEHLLVPRAHPS
jgi:hypothetical protein